MSLALMIVMEVTKAVCLFVIGYLVSNLVFLKKFKVISNRTTQMLKTVGSNLMNNTELFIKSLAEQKTLKPKQKQTLEKIEENKKFKEMSDKIEKELIMIESRLDIQAEIIKIIK